MLSTHELIACRYSNKKQVIWGMKLIKVNCGHCDKEMFVLKRYVRETMFCTLGCMDKSENDELKITVQLEG